MANSAARGSAQKRVVPGDVSADSTDGSAL